ncbi:transporter suffix domain-containing protein [Geobacillus thermodenitrificans]|uniref:transporter suffix domain-containing protein n=1 Tax=Geobacillus thermodenitrificans TaxID=33940 RepID=UPI003D24E4F4
MYRIGIGLIIASFVVWIIPPLAPFLPLSAAGKTLVATGAIVAAEIMFWIGAVLVGKEAAAKLRKSTVWQASARQHARLESRLNSCLSPNRPNS